MPNAKTTIKPSFSPSMQAAVIRGLLRRLAEVEAELCINEAERAALNGSLAKARKGEY